MAEETTEVTSNEIPQEVFHEAESQGWVPKDRFRGNEADWVNADIFVKRGREILPILRKNNENLVRDLNHTREELKEFRKAAEEFKAFQKESHERKVQDYERQLQELRSSRAQAITDGDGNKVNALDDAIDAAKEGVKEAKEAAKSVAAEPVKPAATATIEPDLQEWLGRNTWFGNDKRLTGIANGMGESLRMEFPELKGKAFLEKLDEVLAEEFPNRFGGKTTPTRRTNGSSPVESGSGRQGRGSAPAQSYDNLPPDAKAACDRFVKQKLMTREQYVSEFDWS